MDTPRREPSAPPSQWERIASEPRHDYAMFRTRHDRSRSPTDGEEHDFDIIESGEAVTVVALTEEGSLVMVEQFRHGTRDVVLEFPGGVIDGDEAPDVCGARELREETGYAGGRVESIGRIDLNPAWQDTVIHVVRATGVVRTEEKDLDDGEDTRVRLVPVEEAVRRVRDGSLRNAVAVAALAYHLWAERGGEGGGG